MKYLYILIIFGVFFTVSYLIYREEIKNYLPTTVPNDYKEVPFGKQILAENQEKLLLIHFFNPNCPCSKFNAKHIESLKNRFSSQIDIIAYSTDSTTIDFPIPYTYDKDAKMAKLYGVYSTPQAVLINKEGKLVFRGNYNKSRYCSKTQTEFVRVAIENELSQSTNSSLMAKAGKPYGCSIY